MTDPYSIGPEMVRYVAGLAALELDSSEEKDCVEELNRILAYMKQLKGIHNELEATFQTFPSSNVMRKDEVRACLSPNEVLQNAPEREGPFFKVPPILESEA